MSVAKIPPKPPDPPDPYRDCCLYEKNICRSRKIGRVSHEDLFVLASVEKNSVDDYFTENLHMKDSLLITQWNEKTLIENRLGYSLDSSEKICPHYRFKLGTKWKPSQQCVHPSHEKLKRGKKGLKTFPVTLSMVMKLNATNP